MSVLYLFRFADHWFVYLYVSHNYAISLTYPHCSIVNTNTCTTSASQVKIYLKSSKKLLHVSVFDHHQGVTMSSLKSLLLLTTVGCFMLRVVMWQHVVLYVLGYT